MRKKLLDLFKFVYYTLGSTPLKRIPGIKKLANFIVRKIWPYTTIEVEGSKMYINLNEENVGLRNTFSAYVMNRTHEKTTTEIFRKIIKPGNTFFDLGANIGYFSLLASKHVGEKGSVFSFEPEAKNFFYLKRNKEVNNYENMFPFQKAISNKNGTLSLFFCKYDSGHHTINQYSGIDVYSHGRSTEKVSVEVETQTLDDFIREQKIEKVDVMKIDVEGSEALVVEGAKNTFSSNKDIKIIIEFFPILLEKMGSNPAALIDSLIKDFNFNVFVIGNDYSMEGKGVEFTKIQNSKEIMDMVKDKEDHFNLYVSRESSPLSSL